MDLAILNTSIITADGTFVLEPIELSHAQALVQQAGGILSAVGHEATAQILSDLLGIEVPVNRINFVQQVGQVALVFKLKGRPPEGVILSAEEVEAIGYEFKTLTRIS